ncbi:type IV pilin protein [Candidatus Avelusimicrobium facis]|uniref:type IV pilin protein n=1 Tax=Candidatus Avelusimicrobium facis TaxID=3416203 RepID=UPI003D121C0A
MKNRSTGRLGGFTLIELLVVVLIIGILSAIALPQYQKAVTKARFAEAFTNLKVMAEAIKRCELENGTASAHCRRVENLDLLPSQADNCLNCVESPTFVYSVDLGGLNSEEYLAVAAYKKADACLCILREGTFTAGQGEGCSEAGKTLDFDLNKLLGLPEGPDGCSCC